MQFQIVVCGLDSIEARRWINATLVNMVDMDNQDSLKPLIDGGTEGEYDEIPELEPILLAKRTQVSRAKLASSSQH